MFSNIVKTMKVLEMTRVRKSVDLYKTLPWFWLKQATTWLLTQLYSVMCFCKSLYNSTVYLDYTLKGIKSLHIKNLL